MFSPRKDTAVRSQTFWTAPRHTTSKYAKHKHGKHRESIDSYCIPSPGVSHHRRVCTCQANFRARIMKTDCKRTTLNAAPISTQPTCRALRPRSISETRTSNVSAPDSSKKEHRRFSAETATQRRVACHLHSLRISSQTR